MFLNKIFEVTCTTVQRLAYHIRDIIRKENLPIEQICKVSIDMLLEILDIMDRVSTYIRSKRITNTKREDRLIVKLKVLLFNSLILTQYDHLTQRS